MKLKDAVPVFHAKHVVKITGVKINRLQPWLKEGYIKPSIEIADGHGSRNVYGMEDLYKIVIFSELIKSGISRTHAAAIIKTDFNLDIDDVTPDKWLWLVVAWDKDSKSYTDKMTHWFHAPDSKAYKDLYPDESELDNNELAVALHSRLFDCYRKGQKMMIILDVTHVINQVGKMIEKVGWD